MALRVERKGGGVVTTTSLAKPPLCHTCKQRKEMLFTVDAYGNPQCADCAAKEGHPIT